MSNKSITISRGKNNEIENIANDDTCLDISKRN